MKASVLVDYVNKLIKQHGDCDVTLIIDNEGWIPKNVSWDIYEENGPIFIEIHSDEKEDD